MGRAGGATRGSSASGPASPGATARKAELMAFASPGVYGFGLDGSPLVSTAPHLVHAVLSRARALAARSHTPRPGAAVDADMRELSVPGRSRLASERRSSAAAARSGSRTQSRWRWTLMMRGAHGADIVASK